MQLNVSKFETLYHILGQRQDVIVKLGELTIPADFHVIKTSPSDKGSNPQVLLGRPFLKTASFKLNYYDETFSFEFGNVIEIFQPTRPPIPKEGSVHHFQLGNHKAKVEESVEKAGTKEATKMVKKKKPEKGMEERKAELKCADFKDLIGKLKMISNAFVKESSIGVHLIEDNSKWK
ncbi:hypothetical protein PIB30_071554 [Stylosanthes scabra]|uniref:Reverse transcriptase domain-containing protein n=1 Tax=Stylosanthes scabra TaxID=79078 RepID=A0ABU6QPL3_9FABA|nr:hypothetical protein [Stylosanthes scabra]